MITSSETGNILYKDCGQFGVEVFQSLNIDSGKVTQERIVVLPKTQQKGSHWIKNYIEVNWLVPDISVCKADLARLHEIERILITNLKAYGTFDETPYRYKVESTDIGNEEALGAHFVNARVLFHTMNIN